MGSQIYEKTPSCILQARVQHPTHVPSFSLEQTAPSVAMVTNTLSLGSLSL